ncbi:hypothetical protein [Pseudonocardia sp. 73-21]|uniref:hypothetical protein n=1 Tax=Pseudonocardia sp. 73-21 TaxID=1895809 RepID=UPI00095A0FF2|nr:hypothetical protein [Pseudonocardia sp. 73-21]OJY52596.1 MAG: hypothetical protein BGP03_32305 [Pseudonocardia sp. 73-21]
MIPPGDDDPDARWWGGVSAALAGAADGAGRLALAVAEDWRDGHGQEWAERVALLHRELGRVAAESSEIVAAIARRAPEPPSPPVAGPPTAGPRASLVPPSGPPLSWQEALAPLRAAVLGAAAATRDRGPRLGTAAGERVDDDLGMRIAELSEPDRDEPDRAGSDPGTD